MLATLLNVYRDPKRRGPFTPEDLMPGLVLHQPPDPEAEAMRIKVIFGGIAAAQRRRQEGDG